MTRQWKREVISRCYNLLIKAMFGNHFSDEKCSFKVIKAAWRRSWGPKSRTGSGSLTRSCWLRSKATASPKCRSCNAFDAMSSEAEIPQLKEAIKKLPEQVRYVLVGEALRPRRYEAGHAR